jgi:GDP-4-dehydro-6-deoxy-D-mannose reductase
MSNHQPVILITGGTGFAGSHLVEALLAKGDKNIHVTTYGNKPTYVHSILANQNIHQIDLTSKENTFALIKKINPEQIYHLAALSPVGSSFEQTEFVILNNFKIELNMLEAVKQFSPQAKLLTIGSATQYKSSNKAIKETDVFGPGNPYGVSKVMQESISYSYFKSYKLNIVIARPFNHIGERQFPGFAVPDFIKEILTAKADKKTSIKVGNLESKRDFTDVKDVVAAYMTLMEKGEIGEAYNIGSGKSYQMKEILEKLISLFDLNIKIEIDQNKYRPIDTPLVLADNSKIKKLGWKPTIAIEKTLERIVSWYKSQAQNQS